MLANRLSEDGARVKLIEAGPRDTSPLIHIPCRRAETAPASGAELNFFAEPEDGTRLARSALAARQSAWRRSSSINGMLDVRGNARGLRSLGANGLHRLELRRRAAPFQKIRSSSPPGARWFSRRRRTDGGRTLSHHAAADRSLLLRRAMDSGIPLNPITTAQRRKASAILRTAARNAFALPRHRHFLAPARNRANWRVVTDALAQKRTFDGQALHRRDRAARRGKSIHHRRSARGDRLPPARSRSPHLLQFPASAPPDHLRSIGVDVVAGDARGVGANLSDHYCAMVVHRIQGITSVNTLARGLPLVGEAISACQDRARRADLRRHHRRRVHARRARGLESPDLQLSFTPMSRDPITHGFDKLGARSSARRLRCAWCSRKAAARFWPNPPTRGNTRRSGRTTSPRNAMST